MPRDPDTTPICSPEKADCIHEAIVIVEQTAFDDSRTTETNCQCLPSCSDIEYPHKYSSVDLSRQELVHFPEAIKGKEASVHFDKVTPVGEKSCSNKHLLFPYRTSKTVTR